MVSLINKDTILGMPFLMAHQCTITFKRQVISVDGQPLPCTNRHGRLFPSEVHVVQDTVMQNRTKRKETPAEITAKLELMKHWAEDPEFSQELGIRLKELQRQL